MSSESRSLLIVDDNADHVELVRRSLARRSQVDVHVESTLGGAAQFLTQTTPELMILDLVLPDGLGTNFLRAHPGLRFPVIVLTSQGYEEAAVEALKAGALDYVVKSPSTLDDMPHIVERTLRQWQLILQRQKVEEELRVAELRFRSFLDQTLDAVWCYECQPPVSTALTCDEQVLGIYESVLVDCNDSYARACGAESGRQILGKKFSQLGRVPMHMSLLFDLLVNSGYRTVDREFPDLEDQGSVNYVVSNAHGVVDAGKLIRIWGSFRDVTDRKLAERALRKQEVENQIILDSAPAAIWYKDKNNRIVRLNRAAADSLGIRVEDAEGRLARELFPPEVVAHHDQINDEVIRTGVVKRSLVDRLLTPTGQERWLRSDLVPYHDESGRIIGSILFSLDITAQVLAQDELRRRETELAHVARLSSMGEMVAGIAHELNQPLYAIGNFATASIKALQANRPDSVSTAMQWTRYIAEQATRGGEILQRMRNFSKLAPGESGPVDMNRIVQESLEMLSFEARRSGVAVVPRLAPDLPQLIADRVQMQQVLVNLLRNAYEAVREVPEGQRHVTVSTRIEYPEVVVSVEDSGPGLPAAGRDRLFEAFFTTRPNGLGMGLAISRRIVERHHGRLWAADNKPGGATFCFAVPVAERQYAG